MQSDDMTYRFPYVALWASAELACGILVFSIPAVPKAFAGTRVPSWVSTPGTWTGSFARRKPEEIRNGWPGPTPSAPRRYRSIDEESVVIGLSHLDSTTSAQNLRSAIGYDDTDILRTEVIKTIETYGKDPPRSTY